MDALPGHIEKSLIALIIAAKTLTVQRIRPQSAADCAESAARLENFKRHRVIDAVAESHAGHECPRRVAHCTTALEACIDAAQQVGGALQIHAGDP